MITWLRSLSRSMITVILMKCRAWWPLAVAFMAGMLVNMDFIVNVSDSAAPVGLYRVLWHEPIRKGDLVLEREPLKRLVGAPGDIVQWEPEGVRVNGKLLPNSAVPKGSPYPHYPYQTIKLSPDQFLTMGTNNPLSWDDKYSGPTPSEMIWQKVTSWPW